MKSEIRNQKSEISLRRDYSGLTVAELSTVTAIIDAVAAHFHLQRDPMLSRSRQQSLALPRMIAVHLARKHTICPLQCLAKYFGYRAHGSVMHADAQVVAWSKIYPRTAADVAAIESEIRNQKSEIHAP